MATIQLSHITITPNYNTGTFLHFGIFNSQAKGYSYSQTNIQSAYNLTDKDFLALTVLIGNTVNNYIKQKDKTKG